MRSAGFVHSVPARITGSVKDAQTANNISVARGNRMKGIRGMEVERVMKCVREGVGMGWGKDSGGVGGGEEAEGQLRAS